MLDCKKGNRMRYGMIAAIVVMVGLVGCERTGQISSDASRRTCLEGFIKTRCVVSYQQGDTPYWTDQQQHFCPTVVVFEAWGTEPEGTWRTIFEKGTFTAKGLEGVYTKSLPAGLMSALLAELVYYSFTAGAGFEPTGMIPSEPVRIEGQRYEVFQAPKSVSGKSLTLFKNADTGFMELAQISDSKGIQWMARSYNARYNERFKRMIPRMIDIFDIQQGISAKKLLIQFDYIDVQ